MELGLYSCVRSLCTCAFISCINAGSKTAIWPRGMRTCIIWQVIKQVDLTWHLTTLHLVFIYYTNIKMIIPSLDTVWRHRYSVNS